MVLLESEQSLDKIRRTIIILMEYMTPSRLDRLNSGEERLRMREEVNISIISTPQSFMDAPRWKQKISDSCNIHLLNYGYELSTVLYA